MTIPQRTNLRETIAGYASMVKQYLDQGYEGYLMTLMFNQLGGDIKWMNHQMQYQIENMYASFLTRLHRRPHAAGIIHPILIACPDFPVPKYEKNYYPKSSPMMGCIKMGYYYCLRSHLDLRFPSPSILPK